MATDKTKLYNQKLNYLHKQFLKDQEEALGPQGFFGSYIDEARPSFNKADCEKLFSSRTNAHMCMGRERNGSLASIGFTQAAAIDLVAGLSSSNRRVDSDVPGPPDKDVVVDPNFFTDAARVYITQRGDIDSSLALAKGSEVSRESKNKSAVGIKADHLRFAARNHIKIVTGRGQIEGGDETNSQGGPIERTGRIDLIAGNYTEAEQTSAFSFVSSGGIAKLGSSIKKLQAVPKGDNLKDLLVEMLSLISDVLNFTLENSLDIANLGFCLGSHFHLIEPVPGPPGFITKPYSSPGSLRAAAVPAKMMKRVSEQLSGQFNLGVAELNYLTPGIAPKYINSSHVNLT